MPPSPIPNATSGSWWQVPLVGQSLAAVIGEGAIVLVVKLLQATLIRRLADADSRYYARKLVTLGGWLAVALLITVVFRDRLGGLTVAIGVASAGIAFALQEVIGSIANWIAISFGNFYAPGDRVQLGGIRGDVIDIDILRTTLMELGEWVASDLYTGRVVRIANSFVFKEPVFNDSGDFPFLWDEVRIPVQHGCDHRLARQLLENGLRGVCAEDLIRDSRQAWAGGEPGDHGQLAGVHTPLSGRLQAAAQHPRSGFDAGAGCLCQQRRSRGAGLGNLAAGGTRSATRAPAEQLNDGAQPWLQSSAGPLPIQVGARGWRGK